MNLGKKQANNTVATKGGVYARMKSRTYVNRKSTTKITAECMDVMLYVMPIDILEFPAPQILYNLRKRDTAT